MEDFSKEIISITYPKSFDSLTENSKSCFRKFYLVSNRSQSIREGLLVDMRPPVDASLEE